MNKTGTNISHRILILTEGDKTEKNYFESFKRNDKFKRNLSGVDIKVYKPKDHSPLGLVEEAKKKIKETDKKHKDTYDQVWIVFDRVGHTGIPDAIQKVRDFNKKSSTKIFIGFSNICFEYWILLHFDATSRPITTVYKLVEMIYELATTSKANLQNKLNSDAETF